MKVQKSIDITLMKLQAHKPIISSGEWKTEISKNVIKKSKVMQFQWHWSCIITL